MCEEIYMTWDPHKIDLGVDGTRRAVDKIDAQSERKRGEIL